MQSNTILVSILALGALSPVILVIYKNLESFARQPLLGAENLLVLALSTTPYILLGLLSRHLKPPLVILTSLFALGMGCYIFYVHCLYLIIKPDNESVGWLFSVCTAFQLVAVAIFSAMALAINWFVPAKR